MQKETRIILYVRSCAYEAHQLDCHIKHLQANYISVRLHLLARRTIGLNYIHKALNLLGKSIKDKDVGTSSPISRFTVKTVAKSIKKLKHEIFKKETATC